MNPTSTSAFTLNSREIALFSWTGIALIYCLLKPSIRKPLLSLLKILFSPKIATVILISIGYCFLETICLNSIGVWNLDNIKTTIFWYFGYACLSIFQINNIEKEPNFFKSTVRNTFTILAVIQFITNLYAFHLLIELILLPILALLSAILAFSQFNGKANILASITTNLLAVIGFLIFGYSAYQSITEYESILTLSKAADLVIPSFLTIGFLPYLFLLHVYSSYESCFTSIQFTIKDHSLLPHARKSAIKAFKLKTKYLKRWQNQLGVDWPQTKEGIDKTTSTILKADRIVNARRQPYTPNGWHPSKATKFLTFHGLKQDFYHPIQDGTWTASSQYRELSDKPLSNKIAYYIFGDGSTVYQLQLSLNNNDIKDIKDTEHSIEEFIKTCKILYWKSTKSKMPDSYTEKIYHRETFRSETEKFEIYFEVETWNHGVREGFTAKFKLRSHGAPDGFNPY